LIQTSHQSKFNFVLHLSKIKLPSNSFVIFKYWCRNIINKATYV